MDKPAKSLNVCVLGGTGFIGTELIARLNTAGHRVRVLTRKLVAASHLRVLPAVEVTVANVHAPAVLSAVFAGIDVVINLVGILNESGRSGAGFRRAHTELAASIVSAARATRGHSPAANEFARRSGRRTKPLSAQQRRRRATHRRSRGRARLPHLSAVGRVWRWRLPDQSLCRACCD